MVRLVFRPYTQVRRTICTSVSRRASTRVSSGFALLRHSSPSFGSQQACSHSNPSQQDRGRWTVLRARARIPPFSFLAPCGFPNPTTRTHVRLLGPCYKTGRMESPRNPRPERAGAAGPAPPGDARLDPRPSQRQHARSQLRTLVPRRRSTRTRLPDRAADRSVHAPLHVRPGSNVGLHPLPSRQFQALFNSLFKVLFIFPSRYLFAIGLSRVFSLGRNLPPA